EEAGPALVEEEYSRPSTEKGLQSVPSKLSLSLVSSRHSLWGHRLWNAALLLAGKKHEFVVEGKSVLELGAGAGLPSLICALNGASKVVISDYATTTDQALMVPIQINIDRIQPQFVPEGTLHAVGHVWGQPVGDLITPLLINDRTGEHERNGVDGRGRGDAAVDGRETAVVDVEVVVDGAGASAAGEGNRGGRQTESMREEDRRGGFDVIIMADLLFNRSQHAQLLETCDRCLRTGRPGDATVWVSFSHHDPEKAEFDMKFFALADEKGFVAKKMKTVQMRDLFVENDGLDDLRGEVHLWCLGRR
ncbi:unnamed protein product, partial [Scytosiphon promiscuus]